MLSMLLPVHHVGGMELHTWDLCLELVKQGHSVTVITGKHPRGLKYELKCGVKVYYVGDKAGSTLPFSYWSGSIRKMDELYQEGERFDVVHGQSIAALYYALPRFHKKYSVPLVTTLHGTSIGELKTILRLKLSARALLDFSVQNVIYFLTLRVVARSDILIVVSDKLAEDIKTYFFADPARIRPVYSSLRTDVFRPDGRNFLRRKYKLPPGQNLVLFVSRILEQKGPQFLVQSIPMVLGEVKNTTFVIVGDGPYLPELKTLADKQGISSNVIFCKFVDELPPYYNSCDIVAVPTIREEGLPLVVLEAMSCGKPVVASKLGGIEQVIRDGTNGFLVKPKDVNGLASSIIRLLRDKSLCKEIGNNNRKEILRGYSLEKMAKDTVEAYKAAIGNSRANA